MDAARAGRVTLVTVGMTAECEERGF